MSHSLKKSACTCCALIVHSEVFNCAVGVNGDALNILTADVDNSFNAWICNMNAHSVTADFADIFICKRNFVSAVAGADKISKFFGSQALDLVASVLKCDFSRLNGIDFTSVCYIGNNFAVFI